MPIRTDVDPTTGELVQTMVPHQAPAKTLAGYPVISDPSHALWDEQQAGWPNFKPHEAMSEAVRLHNGGGRANSASHPAFARDYIRNSLATRPDDDAEAGVATDSRPKQEKARR